MEFGFALAVAVVLDATLIRLLLVSAIMKVAGGKANWWLPGSSRMQNVARLGRPKVSHLMCSGCAIPPWAPHALHDDEGAEV
ncbi:MAG: hypothetical protein ACXVII_36030 [Solirubrobacteraceae bacterium]